MTFLICILYGMKTEVVVLRMVSSRADRGGAVLHVLRVVGRLREGMREGQLWTSRPRRLQQPVGPQKAGSGPSALHEEGVLVQRLGRTHAGRYAGGRRVQLGRRRLRQAGPREQRHPEVPQNHTGTPAGEGEEGNAAYYTLAQPGLVHTTDL